MPLFDPCSTRSSAYAGQKESSGGNAGSSLFLAGQINIPADRQPLSGFGNTVADKRDLQEYLGACFRGDPHPSLRRRGWLLHFLTVK
jgi:hypothetical protein